jgi:hypothetical protein
MQKAIGKFKNESGSMVITDPSVDLPINEAISTVIPCSKGLWKVDISYDEDLGFVETLSANFVDAKESSINSTKEFRIDSETGQIGIYDRLKYRNTDETNSISEKDLTQLSSDDKWYVLNSIMTSNNMAGVLKYGCVSRDGIGKGNYNVSISYVNDVAVSILITFFTKLDLVSVEE